MANEKLRAVVGLGNPGSQYARTRHNAGFWFVDRLAEIGGGTFRADSKFQGELAQARVGAETLLLLKPATFMNRSGDAARALAAFYKLQAPDILVAHDELDLPAGTLRLKAGGGHGGHNGLRSLHQHLGEGYLRLRIGIGHPGQKELVHDYVLNRPSVADEKLIRDGIEAALAVVPTLLDKGWERAVHQLHSQG
ncbi:MAG: aminoacyl-tRNA hydrolase [Gammaproteobacteria bacterium]|nr:aminoacyl-tRNA hydrolase [Gammaproteobacteria bacterium]